MVTKIIELCARNRLVVLFGVAVATLAAAWSISRTKIDAIPDLTDPQVIVYTEWMGRSPTLIEDQVTYPVVSALISAPNVVDVRGYSMFGMSFVYVIFEEGVDLYWARSRVLEYLNGLQGRLRPGMYADVVIDLGVTEGISIPADALVDTGEAQYVFVALPGGRFEPRPRTKYSRPDISMTRPPTSRLLRRMAAVTSATESP